MNTVRRGRQFTRPGANNTSQNSGYRPPINGRVCSSCLKSGHNSRDCRVVARYLENRRTTPPGNNNNANARVSFQASSRGRGGGRGRGRGTPSTNDWFQARQAQGRRYDNRGNRPIYNIEASENKNGPLSLRETDDGAEDSHYEDALEDAFPTRDTTQGNE